MSQNRNDMISAQGVRGRKNVPEHRHASYFMKHFGGLGFHTGTLASGEDYDSQFAQSAS
jgi:hypothetical protein